VPTQKTKYSVLRKFTINETNVDGEKSTISLEKDETYKDGDYFEKGKFIPRKHLQLLLENKVIE